MATSSSRIHLQRLGVVDMLDPSLNSPASSRNPSPNSSGTSSRSSCSLRAHIFISFDPSANTAFFKAEAPVNLINTEAQSRLALTRSQQANLAFTRHAGYRAPTRLKVSLHIRPGQITSLAFSRLPRLPDRLAPVYTHLSDKNTLSLQLTLSSPPTLVVPNLPGRLIPHTRSDLALLTAFQRIAGAATSTTPAATPTPTLTLNFYIPSSVLTDMQASSICTGVKPSMTVAEKYTKLDTVFGGLGARETPPDEVAGIVDQTSPTTSPSTRGWSPPAYDASEGAGQALPAYDGGRGQDMEKEREEEEENEEAGRTRVRKRPRRSRSSLSSSPARKGRSISDKRKGLAWHEEEDARLSASQILQQQLDDASSMILRLEALTAEVGAKEALLRARLSEADSKLAELGEATAQHEDEHESSVSEGLEAYIDGRMEGLKDELQSHLDERFEYLGVDMVMRAEMEEFVEEQVAAAIEDLRERLAGGGVRVILAEE